MSPLPRAVRSRHLHAQRPGRHPALMRAAVALPAAAALATTLAVGSPATALAGPADVSTATMSTATMSTATMSTATALARPAAATAPTVPTADESASARTVTLVGDLQSEGVPAGGTPCPADWDPSCTSLDLQPTDVPGRYALDVTLPAGSYQYKVAIDHAWDESYGGAGGANLPLALAGPATLRFSYDDTTHRVAVAPTDLRGDYSRQDARLVERPVRQAGADQQFYFVMTDRFANGDRTNDRGGLTGDRLTTGYDPTSSGFYQGGDLKGLTEKLDYVKGLGTTAIWLTPSFKNKPVQGSGADASAGYHGYWITDFTQIDPHLGTNADLKRLIRTAHAKGMKVYFDIITNHTADVIDYAQKRYDYVETSAVPYTDENGAVVDIAKSAEKTPFPTFSPLTSFPYTPVVAPAEKNVKVPAWLNDVTLYHNRGDSTYTGESTTMGDFSGLDDLMTENPRVEKGFEKIYEAWMDYGIDGFRIDTVKHVNFEFWEAFTKGIQQHATAIRNRDFFTFGEVYAADPKVTSPYVRDTDMGSTLDFTFQSAAAGYANGASAKTLSALFAGDDYYTTADKNAAAQPTFLGNHDMGRIGYFVRNAASPLKADLLAHDLMFLVRGQPVVYYGDEQGFAGTGGDKDARQAMFPNQTSSYVNQDLVTGRQLGTGSHYATQAPVYQRVRALAHLRERYPALVDGAQTERYAQSGPGVYAFSRVGLRERVEHVVAVNNATQAASSTFTTLTPGARYRVVWGSLPDGARTVRASADGTVTLTVPAYGSVVLRADRRVAAPRTAQPVTVAVPQAGAPLTGVTPVAATTGDHWQQTTFSQRVVGTSRWEVLGTSETTTPRVFADVTDLPTGTLVEYRAVSVDARGHRSAASTYGSVGTPATLEDLPGTETPVESVNVPGSFQSEVGCSGDWDPTCARTELAHQADGTWSATLTVPEGSYEYKAAANGSWALNWGADGVQDGPNLTLDVPAGGAEVTFTFDPVTHVVGATTGG